MIRAFFAIDLPDEFRSEIHCFQKELRKSGADVKWVRPGSVHLTLKFLGDIIKDDIAPLADAVAKAAASHPCLELILGGTGVFPNQRKPRVAWLGLGGNIQGLANLHKKVDQACEPFGFMRDKRPFKPHLTIGRIRSLKKVESLLDLMDRIETKTLKFTACEFILFQSILKPTGAEYRELKKISLAVK